MKCEIKLSKKQLDNKSYVYVHFFKCFCTLNNEWSVNSIHVDGISPKNQHQLSPNNITTQLRKMVINDNNVIINN